MNPIDRALEALRACRLQLGDMEKFPLSPTQRINTRAAGVLAQQAIDALEPMARTCATIHANPCTCGRKLEQRDDGWLAQCTVCYCRTWQHACVGKPCFRKGCTGTLAARRPVVAP